jgi:hypothetical protein
MIREFMSMANRVKEVTPILLQNFITMFQLTPIDVTWLSA